VTNHDSLHPTNVSWRLAERVKELTALRQAVEILADRSATTPDLLNRIAALLPPAFQFPEVAEACVCHAATIASTPGYANHPVRLTSVFHTRDRVAGRVEVIYREARPDADEGPFLTEERHLLDAVAELVKSALDHRSAEERFRLLLRVTNVVTAELDLKVLLGTISRLLAEDVGHRLASIVLWDADEGVLRRHVVVAADGTTAPHSPDIMRHADAPAIKTFRTKKTQVYQWSDVEALGEEAIGLMRQVGLRSLCCVPLQTARDCHGVLMVGRPDDVPYSPADIALLDQVAHPLATAIENALAYRRISDLRDRLADEKIYLEGEVTREHEFDEIVGQSRALSAVLHQVRTVAPTDSTVLLLGETGTGKELVARAIHESSRRHARSFIRINSAALPSALVESELFGYERGAFTGAVSSKAGRLELAHQGTLFLDEVGELPLDVQPKLLRAIQEREFERLGGTTVRRVDVRLIAATNRDLERMVADGEFRSDLYYRLSVFPIRVPPLRERPEDIPFLVRHFVGVFSRQMHRTITTIPAKTFAALQQWHWPGNIRELQNVIERAVILSRGSTLEVPDSTFQEKAQPDRASGGGTPVLFTDGEREIILNALRAAGGIIGGPQGAAARLGLRRTTLQSKMRRLGIVRPSF
jgi:formate hydrogenlyase transcriptional activator